MTPSAARLIILSTNERHKTIDVDLANLERNWVDRKKEDFVNAIYNDVLDVFAF